MSDQTRWKAKANIWKRAYDEEHASVTDMQLRFEVEKKRADALEHNIRIAQQYAEHAASSAQEAKARYENLERALDERVRLVDDFLRRSSAMPSPAASAPDAQRRPSLWRRILNCLRP
jgi:hypothetical protein